ncbi:lipopolysaccharide biosynthesis [Mycobacteroides abscessus subsp. abscessus]|nr:lipopolysaccharide biosynthesis [Mycobacteroides abscessus subsp. abscessus]
MRNPSVHQLFNVLNHKGLTDLLTDDQTRIQDIVHQTVIKNLFILSCGIIPPNPSELLASNRMDQLLRRLKDSFDLIIFDLPPIKQKSYWITFRQMLLERCIMTKKDQQMLHTIIMGLKIEHSDEPALML